MPGGRIRVRSLRASRTHASARGCWPVLQTPDAAVSRTYSAESRGGRPRTGTDNEMSRPDAGHLIASERLRLRFSVLERRRQREPELKTWTVETCRRRALCRATCPVQHIPFD